MSRDLEREEVVVKGGVERLLGMAAADPAFRRALHDDAEGIAVASGVSLGTTERAMLATADGPTLNRLIDGIGGALPDNARRDFMRLAGAALVVFGGGALAGCPKSKQPTPPKPLPKVAGVRPDRPLPPKPRLDPTPAGVRPDRPVPLPDPRPRAIGGLVTSRPQPIGGAMADKPGSGSGSGTAKPKPKPNRPRPTRGIRPDRPKGLDD